MCVRRARLRLAVALPRVFAVVSVFVRESVLLLVVRHPKLVEDCELRGLRGVVEESPEERHIADDRRIGCIGCIGGL